MAKNPGRNRDLDRNRLEEAAWNPLLRVARKRAFARLIIDLRVRKRRSRDRNRLGRSREFEDD